MKKHYLLFASHSYAYSIMRPLQEEIRRRGDLVAWYLEDTCPDMLQPDEVRMHSIDEVMAYNPIAVFAPGNWIYDFFPGVKVAVFHGYPINKRAQKKDDHFTIRGWFDIYCTQGESSTRNFKKLEEKHRFFKVYETGWCKVDDFFKEEAEPQTSKEHPTILYGTTFTKGISSAERLLPYIEKIASKKNWKWILTFHPKLNDAQLIADYEAMAKRHDNVIFTRVINGAETFRKTDVLLCDSSSIIIEYMLFDKPVVTFRNINPGNHLLDVQNEEDIEYAIETALTHPPQLIENIHSYASYHESHRDGKNCARILDAVDDFIANYKGRIKKKPLNLIRKLKLRWKLKKFYPL